MRTIVLQNFNKVCLLLASFTFIMRFMVLCLAVVALSAQMARSGEAEEKQSMDPRVLEQLKAAQQKQELTLTMMHVFLTQGTINNMGTADFGLFLEKYAKSGSISVDVFQIEEGKLVIALQKGGRDGRAIYNMLKERPEVDRVVWDDMAKTKDEL